MIAAVLDNFRKDIAVANAPVAKCAEAAHRFEPVSRILDRCDEESMRVARIRPHFKANA